MENSIAYGQVGERPLTLDICRPAGKEETPSPLVIYAFDNTRPQIGVPSVVTAFATQGPYVCASIRVRQLQQYVLPTDSPECRLSIDWLKANADQFGIDARRIGLWVDTEREYRLYTLERSPGGVLAAKTVQLEGTRSESLKQVRAFYGRQLCAAMQKSPPTRNLPSEPHFK